MSLTVLRAMWLSLLRDRAALLMSFVLPAVVFLIFAAIFAGATGSQLSLDVAVSDQARTSESERLVAALCAESSLRCLSDNAQSHTPDQVRDLVRRGTADVGLIVREGARLDSLGGFGPAPLIVISDPARGVAVPMLAGQIQRVYFAQLPDVALGGVVKVLEDQFLELDDEQREQVAQGLDDLRTDAVDASGDGRSIGFGFEEMTEVEAVTGRPETRNHVAYYAGSIAIMFLLFSSVQGAISLLEERESGVLERILSGPVDIGVVVNGKFLFLLLQGVAQIGVIFVIAWLLYDVDLPGHLLGWLLTTVAASAAAAGLALVVAGACRTRRQAQSLSTVAILILSALGGSMIPRFLMPDFLQQVGWLTPNTWAIEAYTSLFWRDAPLSELLLPWAVLLAAAAVALMLARGLARRMVIL